MGKATITIDKGEGLYTVELDHGQASFESENALLDEKIAQLNIDIAAQIVSIDAAEAVLSGYQNDLNVAIDFYSADPSEANKAAVDSSTKNVNDQTGTVVELTRVKAQLVTTKNVCVKRQAVIFDIYENEPETIDLWCADLNEGLTGDVGTIEVARQSGGVPGKVDNAVSGIRPAGTDGDEAAYNPDNDGQLLPVTMFNPNAAYNSYALQPGAVKWKARYRRGTITAKDGETCTVDLDPVFTTDQDFNGNQDDSIECGFQYMNCNGVVFAVDDYVWVWFEDFDWTKPFVVGFVTNPRPCFTDNLSFLLHSTLLPRPTFIGDFETLSANQLFATFSDIDEDGDPRFGFVPSDFYPYNITLLDKKTYLVRPNQMVYEEYVFDTDHGQQAEGLISLSDLWMAQNGTTNIASFGKTTKPSDSGTRSHASSSANDSNIFCVASENESTKYIYWIAGTPNAFYSRWADIPTIDQPDAIVQFGTEVLHLNRFHITDVNGALQESGILDSRTTFSGAIPPTTEFTLERPQGIASNNNFVCVITDDEHFDTLQSFLYIRIYDTSFNVDSTLINGRLRASQNIEVGAGPSVGFGQDYMALIDPEDTTSSIKVYTATSSVTLKDTLTINYVDPVPPPGGSLPPGTTWRWLACDGVFIVLYVVNAFFPGSSELEVQVYQWSVNDIDTADITDFGMVKRFEVERVVGSISFRYPYVGNNS